MKGVSAPNHHIVQESTVLSKIHLMGKIQIYYYFAKIGQACNLNRSLGSFSELIKTLGRI